jgi:hypothetical protein
MSTNNQSNITLQIPRENPDQLCCGEYKFSVSEDTDLSKSSKDTPDMHPGGSLLLGLAKDGTPQMLDLYTPTPGPLLVAADEGCGKTTYLESLAQASIINDPGEIQFGVLTPFPEEWKVQESMPNCMGIWPTYHSSAHGFLSRLISWAEVLPFGRQIVLVLIDDLELLTAHSSQLNEDLRWLLINGPERYIWPVVSVNPGRLIRLEAWLSYFQTRILGQVKLLQTAQALVDDQNIDLACLLPGKQFFLSNSHINQKIWLPPVEKEYAS